MDASSAIEAKLHKSLEDLIKEQASKSGGRAPGRSAGPKGPNANRGAKAGGAPRVGGARKTHIKDNAMDVDMVASKPRRRVDTSMLQPKGGVAKRGRAKETATPKGNLNAKWTNDLFEDDGPAQPRRVAGATQRQSRGGPVQNMTVVRICNLPTAVTHADMVELVSMVERPKHVELVASDVGATCEVHMHSEKAARKVVEQYQDCALDGQALKVQLGGTQARTTLKSGLGVVHMRTKGHSAPMQRAAEGGQGVGGHGPRGRGSERTGMRGY